MALSHAYQMFNCVCCKSTLRDSNFFLCGINLNVRKTDIFFDYKCGKCGHHGRYIIPQDYNITAKAALGKLAEMVSGGSPEDDDTEVNSSDTGHCEFNGT